MGSGASMQKIKRLVCPPDYEEHKFKILVQKFDKLDTDGDHSLVGNESLYLANQNQYDNIQLIKSNLNNYRRELKHDLKIYEIEEKEAHEKIEYSYSQKKNLILEKINTIEKKANEEITKLAELTNNEKLLLLQKTISNKNGDTDGITFWEFFEFMKNKDISEL